MVKFKKAIGIISAVAVMLTAICMLIFIASAGDYTISEANAAYTVKAPSYGNPNNYRIYVTGAGTMSVRAQNIESTGSGAGKWVLYKGTPDKSGDAAAVTMKEYSGGNADGSVFSFSSELKDGVRVIDATAVYLVAAGSYYLSAFNTNPYSSYTNYAVSVSGVGISVAPSDGGTVLQVAVRRYRLKIRRQRGRLKIPQLQV